MALIACVLALSGAVSALFAGAVGAAGSLDVVAGGVMAAEAVGAGRYARH
jgi:hypothetical protein